MARPKAGPRVSKPYFCKGRPTNPWKIVCYGFDPAGKGDGGASKPKTEYLASEEDALIYKRVCERKLTKLLERTVEDAIDEWSKYRTLQELSVATHSCTKYDLLHMFPLEPIASIGWKGRTLTPLSAVSREVLRGLYLAFVERPGPKGERYSAANHRKALSRAKTFLRYCMDVGWLSEEHVDKATKVKGVGRVHKGKDQLLRDDIRKWETMAWTRTSPQALNNLESPARVLWRRWRATAALIAFRHGIRTSAIARLQVKHLDDGGTVLSAPFIKNRGSLVKPYMAPDLQALMAELCDGRDREEYVFGRRRGKGWVTKSVKEICAAAGVPLMTAHAMRGTMASSDYREHGDIGRTASRLGDTAAVALDHYVTPQAQADGDAIRIQRALEARPRVGPKRTENFGKTLSDKENVPIEDAK